MANKFNKALVTGIGTSLTSVYATSSTTRATVIGINIANLVDSEIYVDIKLTDENNLTGYIVKGVLIPPNQSLAAMGGDQKLVLVPNNTLKIASSAASSVDVIISVLEIA